jgi:hypothetical protein
MDAILRSINRATLEARKRTGDDAISVQVGAGKAQVVRVYYTPSGHSSLTPMSPNMPVDQVVAYLDSFTV